jgi:PleD family two-component response regulator
MKMNLARLNIAEARVALPFTVLTAAIAGCAAIGVSFLLVLSSPLPPSPTVTVLGLGTLFSLFLVLVTDRSAAQARTDAEAQAVSDPSSGLLPAPLGRRLLNMAFAAAERGQPLTIVLFSVDGLARHRTVHGQASATRVLRNAGRALGANTRGMHMSSRFNGEAVFLSILSGVSVEGARTFAERVRKDYSRLVAPGEPTGLSAAVVAYETRYRSADRYLEQAQKALAEASAQGGKVVAVELVPPGVGSDRQHATIESVH